MQYFDPGKRAKAMCPTSSTSIGVDRMVLQVLSAAYREE